jgi:hypothetical protein
MPESGAAPTLPPRHELARWLPFAAAGVATLFVGFMLLATYGQVVPQVVDLYLIAQYAKAWAEGHPFQYNSGEAPSTGATSFLWTIVLGLAHFLGAHGEGLIAAAIALGAACFVLSVVLAERLGRVLGGPREGVLAGLLVTLGGPVVWGFLYGSDTAPFMLLSLWLFERLVVGSMRGAVVAASLLALARPEGLIVAVVLAVRALWLRPRSERVPWCVPLAIGIGLVFLSRALTGYWMSTSGTDKSLLSNYGLIGTTALVSEYATEVIRGILLGLYPGGVPIGITRGWASHFFVPLGLVLAILGWHAVPAERKEAAATWAVVLVVVGLLVLPNIFLGVHFHRYLMWAFPSLHVMIAVGVGALARGSGDAARERVFRGIAALAVVLGLFSTLRMAAVYGENAGEIHRRDVAAAAWIKRNLPAGVKIANAATSIEYLTGHRNTNLHGVTSPAFFGNRTAEREAGTWEALGRLSVDERPDYVLASVSGIDSSAMLPELLDGPALFQSLSFGDELVLHRMRYDLVGRQHRLLAPRTLAAVAGLTLVDQLNVCDSADEAAHGYGIASTLGSLALGGNVRKARYADTSLPEVMDAGRAIFGSERFTVKAKKGRELVIVLRTTAVVPVNVMRPAGATQFEVDIPHATVDVMAEGLAAQQLHFQPGADWEEVVLRVRGDWLGAEKTALELRGRYASFHYWFFQ